MKHISKENRRHLSDQRKMAFKRIAVELGKEHNVVKMMGSLAWGRHKAELDSKYDLRQVFYELGALDGYFDILNTWARDNDSDAQKVLLKHYSKSFEI